MRVKQGTWILTVGVLAGLWSGAVAVTAEEPPLDPAETELDINAESTAGMHPDRSSPAFAKKPIVLSPKQEKEVLDFVNKHMKGHAAGLAERKKRNPQAYQRTLVIYWMHVRQFQAMPAAVRDAHVKNANLRLHIIQTVKQYRQAKTDAERLKYKTQLKTQLSEKFNVEQQVREHRLKKMDNQLARLKKEHANRAANRSRVIDRQLHQWLAPAPKSKPAPTPSAPPPATPPTTAPTTQPATPKAK